MKKSSDEGSKAELLTGRAMSHLSTSCGEIPSICHEIVLNWDCQVVNSQVLS